MSVSPLDLRLLDRWQRDFPLTPRPFAEIAAASGLGEEALIARLAALQRRGAISRVGAVVRPNTVGASTLAAMAVPPTDLDEVAARVSAEPAVNHNYEREHRLNLWFVVTAPDRTGVEEVLARIEADTGIVVLDLPLERAYHIDLGFRLDAEEKTRTAAPDASPAPIQTDADDRALLVALENGLPLVERPYAALAGRLRWTEDEVMSRLARLIEGGVISRFGVVVKHRTLGFAANAMAVWDVPDGDVDRIADIFARHPFVTLCYRRPRRQPDWPYNLFCMVHGRDRATVTGQLATLNRAADTAGLPHAVLFSRRCFKQRGARFSTTRQEAVA
jgi:DNA-binding Lrp family transcriptional regulator